MCGYITLRPQKIDCNSLALRLAKVAAKSTCKEVVPISLWYN